MGIYPSIYLANFIFTSNPLKINVLNKYFLIICFLLSFSVNASEDDTLFVKGVYSQHIVDYFQRFEDCKAESKEEIIQHFNKGEFQDMAPSRIVNLGFTSCLNYFSLKVTNDQAFAEDYYWSFYNDGILFTLYELKNGRLIEIGETSVAQKLEERPTPIRCLSFKVEMQAFETKTLILKTKLQGHSNLYFPTDFTTVEDILIYEANNSFLLGRYFGYFTFTALFNLFLFILIRRKLYGFMFGYILSMMAFNAIEYMYDVHLVPDFLHRFWTHFPKMFFVLLSSYFHTKVFQYFTAHKEHFPKWNSILNLINNFILFILILFVVIKIVIPQNTAFFDQYRLLLFLLFLINLTVLVINLFYSIYKKNKQSVYYICCNFLLILSLLFYITNTFQVGGATIYMPPGNIINSVAFEILSLTIAFLLNYRKELNEMNQNLAAAKLKSEKLSEELIEVQENERQIIARNLHDGLGNTMNALRLLLEAPYKNEKQITGIFNLAKDQFRNLIYQISPKEIEKIGLYTTIQQDLELFKNTSIEVNLTLLGDDHTIENIKAVNIYRIFQELISNIIKHSKATIVDITLNCDESTCSLQIEDNGIGLKEENTNGMGIKNIKSRVSYHQGIFHIENTGKGMISIIEIPI